MAQSRADLGTLAETSSTEHRQAPFTLPPKR